MTFEEFWFFRQDKIKLKVTDVFRPRLFTYTVTYSFVSLFSYLYFFICVTVTKDSKNMARIRGPLRLHGGPTLSTGIWFTLTVIHF